MSRSTNGASVEPGKPSLNSVRPRAGGAVLDVSHGIDDAETRARWLRFDLNLDGHVDERSICAHLHVVSDDWLLSAPACRPLQLRDLLLVRASRPQPEQCVA